MLLLITIALLRKLIRKLFLKTTVIMLAIGLASVSAARAQTSELKYKIMHSGDEIGWIRITKQVNGQSTRYSLVSEVRKRVVFLYTVSEKQECEFINSKLVASSVFRKVNGKVKIDRSMTRTANGYEVVRSGIRQQLDLDAITSNLLTIYFTEPGTDKVYSDNLQQYIDLTKKWDHCYDLDLPGGNHTRYYYSNGICEKVKVKHSWFNVEFVLTEKN